MPKQLEMLEAPAEDTSFPPEAEEDGTEFPPPPDESPASVSQSIRETIPASDEEMPDDLPDDDDVEMPASQDVTRVAPKPVLDVLPRLKPWADICAGVVLGGAIGDAMGHPTEFIGTVAAIRAKYGPEGVTKYELWWDRGGKKFAPYTDDTQMAEAVLRTLVDARGDDLDANMELMAKRFIDWSKNPQGGHRAPGNACLSGCRALEAGKHWSEAGGPQAGGCGSVMRAYPFGLLFAQDLRKAEEWSVAHSKLTHRDPIALAASAAMAVGVALLARGESVEHTTAEMVAAACRYSAKTAAMMATAIDDARSGIGPEVTLDRLRAWAAHEAIASAVYLLERHPDDPRAAILEGANTPGDSDSIATLAGSLVGARVGARGLPVEWVKDVERADELMALALSI